MAVREKCDEKELRGWNPRLGRQATSRKARKVAHPALAQVGCVIVALFLFAA